MNKTHLYNFILIWTILTLLVLAYAAIGATNESEEANELEEQVVDTRQAIKDKQVELQVLTEELRIENNKPRCVQKKASCVANTIQSMYEDATEDLAELYEQLRVLGHRIEK